MSSEPWPPPEVGPPLDGGDPTETGTPPGGGPGPLPRRRLLLTGVFVAVVAVGLISAWALGGVAGGEDTDLAPDFTVTTFDGRTFTLSQHLADDGRPVLLNLWASWCAPCRAEIPAISAWSQANPEVYVIGVAVEDVESAARELAAELQPSYELAMGDEIFRSNYPSLGLPATYVIDESGRIDQIHNGILTEATIDDLFSG